MLWCSWKINLTKNNVMWITSLLSLALLLFALNFIRVIMKRNAHKYNGKQNSYSYFKNNNAVFNRLK